MIHTDGTTTIANAPPIPGQLDIITELRKIAAPTKDELIRLSKLEAIERLAESA